MKNTIHGLTTVLGRLLLSTIFLMSAVGNKIPNFDQVASTMKGQGIPQPQVMLAGAILFLVAGSLSIILGYTARIGATLLLIFLGLATYYFHDFWNFRGETQQAQIIQFMKNLGLMGAMLLIMANGSGAMSLDKGKSPPKPKPAK
jgi:putative oxidoreductase